MTVRTMHAPARITSARFGCRPTIRRCTSVDCERYSSILPIHFTTRQDSSFASVVAEGCWYNAAIGSVARFLTTTPAHSMAVLDVNCRGPLLLVHTFVPPMVARGRGGVILMSSMSGNYGSEQLAVYAASKAFNLVLGDALWAELGPLGVDVRAVQPGSTRTPGWQSSQPPELRGPGPHVMEPSEVVAAALAHLGDGPNLVPGEMNRQGVALLASMPRAQAVELASRITRDLIPNV